ncbi:respiratory nitrate reductase subunit gamma [Streptacidiphilus sp. NEAU-YB345]|uniref:Respiratory nitrate reductase subunit gamma n=1 Tax=Streptacidiphilus fuscans TaxID=2789292 RepID=A0A931B696_9ACTN|nr:respiratory nitrate reductase subunit gamma [Streptacidiphilus fuscans]
MCCCATAVCPRTAWRTTGPGKREPPGRGGGYPAVTGSVVVIAVVPFTRLVHIFSAPWFSLFRPYDA